MTLIDEDDFNLSTIIWEPSNDGFSLPVEYLTDDASHINANFIHSLNFLDLRQYNKTPNVNGRHLDLLLRDNDPSMICGVRPDLVLSDKIDVLHPPF